MLIVRHFFGETGKSVVGRNFSLKACPARFTHNFTFTVGVMALTAILKNMSYFSTLYVVLKVHHVKFKICGPSCMIPHGFFCQVSF